MTALGRAIRSFLERALGRFHEGPRLPKRFLEMTEDFAWRTPRPTHGEWVGFAVGLAASAYRDAYLRGFECSERYERPWSRSPSPEDIADAEDPGWRDRRHWLR